MKNFIHSRHKSLVGLGLVAALGASAFAVAQPAPTQPEVPAARMVEDRDALREEHLAMRAERRAAREAGREARLEGRLSFMRTRLSITDAQAPLWDALAENLRNNMAERVEARPEPHGRDAGRPSVLERLEREQERIAVRSEHLESTAAVLVPLYNALDDEQKLVADRVFRRLDGDQFAMRGGAGARGGPNGDMRRGRRGGGPDFDGRRFGRGPERL